MRSAIIRETIPLLITPIKTKINFYLRVGNTLFNTPSRTTTKTSLIKSNSQPHSMMSDVTGQNQSLENADCSEKVYVQRNLDKNMMTISFRYTSNGRSKQFNLYRKASEPLSFSLERLKLNLSKLNNRGGKLKSKITIEELPKVDDILDLCIGGSTIDPDNTKNIDAWVEGAVLEVNGKSYYICTEAPQVESLKLPSCMMNNFIIMPGVSLLNCNVDDCKFAWYRQISAKERENIIQVQGEEFIEFDGRSYWYRVSTRIAYCPTKDDVAHHLKIKCWPSDGIREGPESMCISNGPVEVGPPNCPFEKRHCHTQDIRSGPNEFRFVTYNILADLYADSDYSRSVLFGHCPSHALDIEYREQLLLKEIMGYNADLICLQEVDKKEFIRTYEPFFKLVGNYSGIFNTKGGQVAEGCATFYRNEKFEMIASHKTLLRELIEPFGKLDVIDSTESSPSLLNDVDGEGGATDQRASDTELHPILCDRDSSEAKKCLSKFDEIRSAILSNQELRKRFCERHTILQTTLLKPKNSSNNFILVANTHLYFAPDADHIRLLQGCVCVKYLEYIKDFYKHVLISNSGDLEPNISVLFCGDMNSTPDCGLYKLLTKGKVCHNLPDWSSNQNEAVVGLSVETHLRFLSAYEDIEYTNYTPEFKGCLDYIYYERDGLICESTVPLPDHEDVTAIGGIPSDVFPSDHLALIANLNHLR